MVVLHRKVYVSVIEYWDLEFICYLDIVIWCLKLCACDLGFNNPVND